MLDIQLSDLNLLLFRPLVLFDLWVQLIEPSLSALLSNAAWDHIRDDFPVPFAVLSDVVFEDLILLRCPLLREVVPLVGQIVVACVALDHRLIH